jgi:16S rRNA A1518/A1519 N6-dimethyltransferase RsmA/KsgA/DIM1 with predicted DNA glycosylase/AP lyase activity
MIWLIVILFLLACFSSVLLFGAPYLPTLSKQIDTALDLAELKAGDTLLELGCGDGRVVLAAARQGVNVVGYELNPILAAVAWIRTRSYKHNVQIIWGDFWKKDWPEASVVFVFLLPKYMAKLDTKVMQYKHKPVKLISFAFEVRDKTHVATRDGLFVYDYH